MHPQLSQWQQDRLVAVIRADSADQALALAHTARQFGIRQLEITLTFPTALTVAVQLGAGVGTVRTPEQAEQAVAAGVKFLVSPITDPAIITVAKAAGIMVVSGAWTPTEVHTAWQLGVDAIKLFPAQIGGPTYLPALRQILPEVIFFPCGGVTLASAPEYLAAGAIAVGLGQGLLQGL